MTTCIIEVTQEDIDVGERLSCKRCPVARAISRFFKGIEVQVTNHEAFVYFKIGLVSHVYEWTEIWLPIKVQLCIEDFDEGRPVKPFTFTIQIPL